MDPQFVANGMKLVARKWCHLRVLRWFPMALHSNQSTDSGQTEKIRLAIAATATHRPQKYICREQGCMATNHGNGYFYDKPWMMMLAAGVPYCRKGSIQTIYRLGAWEM